MGHSVSGVIGERIGSVGSAEVAETIFNELERVRRETGVSSAFQDCEHTNRVITTKREDYNPSIMEEVTVVPDVHVGGSLATYAHRHMNDLIIIEYTRAPKGIDIGQTLVGVHINRVCAPLRTSVKEVGEAIITIAASEPKKIGGERAKYE